MKGKGSEGIGKLYECVTAVIKFVKADKKLDIFYKR